MASRNPSASPPAPDPGQPGHGGAGPRFELLTLGDELLLGLTANSHLTFIGAQLGRRGVQLARHVTIDDRADVIAAEFRAAWERADVVIITGGLGPTCDDRTREAIAGVLGRRLVYDPAIEQAIAERFARFGRKMTSNNLKQAYKFEGGEVLPNPNGTAPGLWVEQNRQVLVMLPGPPVELQPMFIEQVLPRLATLGRLAEGEAYLQIRTAGVGESALETRLQPTLDRAGDALNVAYCAHQGRVDLRLSSPSGGLGPAGLRRLADECAELLGEDFVCFGHDSAAKVVSDLLRAQEKTLAVAESCTGGLLAGAFTDLCGATKVFRGALICHGNDAKTQVLGVPECLLTQHGAVSAECAVAMATGVAEALEADYGLAVTGYTGAADCTPDEPTGTIYLGLHSPHGAWSKKLNYPGPRAMVRERGLTAAIDWLRRELVRAARGQVAAERLTQKTIQ